VSAQGEAVRAVAYVRAPVYARGYERHSIDEQRGRIENFVRERGWTLVEVYEDAVKPPGEPQDRPALAKAIASAGSFDKLVVTKLDRLAASVQRSSELIAQLGQHGADVVSIDEGFDTGTEAGAVVPKLLSLAAHWDRGRRANEGWSPDNLRKPGFAPATVIDVGAAAGTPDLYHAFPAAHHVLIEPMSEYEPDLRRLADELGGEYLLTAVGSSGGEATMEFDPQALNLAAVAREGGRRRRLQERSVPIATLDDLRAERGWSPPFGLKIDTEGHEREVIEGATRLLEETEFVIAETSVQRREGDYSFAQFVALMDEHGFELCDVLHAARAASTKELEFVDALFRRREGGARPGLKPLRYQSVETIPDPPPYSAELIEGLGLRGLHCGCGRVIEPGWLNSDLRGIVDGGGNATKRGTIARLDGDRYYLEQDSTDPFPLADGCFEWAYSEHFIEHVPMRGAVSWLREMRRLLKPGGVLRLSTPDLRRYVEGYLDREGDFFAEHRRHLLATGLFDDKELPERRGWMVNQIFYRWGHRWVYDLDELRHVAERAGFGADSVAERAFGQSSIDGLAALDREQHSDESVYVEITKTAFA
jgi:FkbM family methyltransferase